MIRLSLIMFFLVTLTACGDDNKETEAEYDRKVKAADDATFDTTVPSISDGSNTQAMEPRSHNGDLSNHPLAQFFIPEGYEALKYVGRIWKTCDKNHTAYTAANCQRSLERGIRVGESIGIRLTESDLNDPKYWEKVKEIGLLNRQVQLNAFKDLGRNPTLKEQKDWTAAFKAKEAQLMAQMDDK